MKYINEKKICFIICSNNSLRLNECLLYLELLEIPQGYETELYIMENVLSIPGAYNECMTASNAKYKIYLTQDSLVVKRDIICKLLEIFRADNNIGLIGMVGSEKISKTGIISKGELYGREYYADREIELVNEDIKEVDAVCGGFMATQYDLKWREDLQIGWNFFDTSQCLEYKRAGYKIVIPRQEDEWIVDLNRGRCANEEQDKCRENILSEYEDIIKQKQYKRILFVHSDMIILGLVMAALIEMGHEVMELKHKVKIAKLEPSDIEIVRKELEHGFYDLVMTYDFVEAVSYACQNEGVKYCSWVYDSPLLNLYAKSAKNDVNYICVFDRKQYERLKDNRFKHLAYFPLAAGTGWFGTINITEEDEKDYNADVTFVGNLYSKRGFETIFQDAPSRYLEEAYRIINEHNCQWDGTNRLFGKASEELISHMISKESPSFFDYYNIDKRYYCESVRLAGKCNEVERVTLLNEIAQRHKVVLYTSHTENDELKNVDVRSAVGYVTEMPKIFYLSKININISSRSIESGIPQRVWDILAVGGFCLTNYQPELEEYFEIGKDLEVYHNKEEMMYKIAYYLKNEKERMRIAINGYKKVRQKHTYEKRMGAVLAWIFDE